MKVIEPANHHRPDWQYGDILFFSGQSFVIANVNSYTLLVSLDSGQPWYNGRDKDLVSLRSSVEKDYKVSHYPKSDYRMYLEAP